MAGGLLNLIAIGNQNVILNGNPSKTFWKSTYKRYTNFGLQNFRLDYEGLRELQTSSESVFTFKVKRYAELLMGTYLVINLPDIYSPILPPQDCTQGSSEGWSPYEFKWIKNLGAMIIGRIRFTIGGTLIQEMSGYELLALANRDLSATQKSKWDQMTGNIAEINDPANAMGRINSYPNAVYTPTSSDTPGAEPSIRARQLHVPLPIWWGMTSQQAFPLVSLQYNELQIEVTLRPIQELFQIRDVEDYDFNHPVIAPNFNLATQQFYRFLQTPPNPELEYSNKATSWNENIHLSCTYCFLSDDESVLFAKQEQQYLIKELYHTWFQDIDISDKAWLRNSSGMVCGWMIMFQRSDVNLRNEWSNFTNWPYDYLPYDITPLAMLMDGSPCPEAYAFPFGSGECETILNIDAGTLGYGINPSGNETGLFSTGSYRYENQKEILLTLGILFDGSVREEMRPAEIYSFQQPYLASNGYASSKLPGLYYYNFELDTSPFKLQPTGAINLSKFSKIEIEFTTYTPVVDPNASYNIICDPETGVQIGVNKPSFQLYDYTYNLLVIEERYNVITFVAGNAALMSAR